jgi:hypothetical protein
VNLPEQALAGLRVEVMQEVRQKYDVVIAAEIYFEGAALNTAPAIAYPCVLCILFSHLQNIRPVERNNLGAPVMLRDCDSEHAVACGYIQHLGAASVCTANHLRYRLRGHCHHRRHSPGKLHPDRIFRSDRSSFRNNRSAPANAFRQVFESTGEHRGVKKFEDAAHVGWRTAI